MCMCMCMCVCVERERGERENCLNRHGPPRSRRSPYEPPTVETWKAVSGEDVPELEWCQCQGGEKGEEEEEEKEEEDGKGPKPIHTGAKPRRWKGERERDGQL